MRAFDRILSVDRMAERSSETGRFVKDGAKRRRFAVAVGDP